MIVYYDRRVMTIMTIVICVVSISLLLNLQDSLQQMTQLEEPININSAPYTEIVKLPGINKQQASNIVMYRNMNGPFSSYEELTNVAEVSPKSVDMMREWIYFF